MKIYLFFKWKHTQGSQVSYIWYETHASNTIIFFTFCTYKLAYQTFRGYQLFSSHSISSRE